MIWYRLEISREKPTQFRITVVRSDVPSDVSDATFQWIGIYKTPEEVTEQLEPYLRMEEGGT